MRTGVGILLVIGLLLSALPGSPPSAYACSCADGPTLREWIELADAIFAGRVISTERVGEMTRSWVERTGRYPFTRVDLEVRLIWKGKVGPRVVIGTGIGGGDCGFEFTRGRDYLVFGTGRYPPSDPNDPALWTGLCEPTDLIAASAPALRMLGLGRAPSP